MQREVGALRSLVSDSLGIKGLVGDYREYLGRDDEEVDLQSFSCTCLDFQDLMYPCKHALRLIIDVGKNWREFVGNCYSMANYKCSIQVLTCPVRLAGLNKSSKEILPPYYEKKTGRPKKKRIASRGEAK